MIPQQIQHLPIRKNEPIIYLEQTQATHRPGTVPRSGGPGPHRTVPRHTAGILKDRCDVIDVQAAGVGANEAVGLGVLPGPSGRSARTS